MIDLTNTWCEATEENYNALVKLGIYEALDWSWKKISTHSSFKKDHIFCIKQEEFKDCFSWFEKGYQKKSQKQIHLVDGTFQYVKEGLRSYQMDKIKEAMTTKKECQFAKYGFEKLENGHILEKVGNWLIGYYHPNDNAPIPCLWFEHDGTVSNNVLNVPNLTPIKKEWYEDENNFGKVLIDTGNNSGLYIFKGVSYHSDIERKVIDAFSVSKLKECRLVNFENFRPATESEIFSLKVDFKK